jgi:hypothetical protein
MASQFFGRLVYSGIYILSDIDGIDGEIWFIEEQGHKEGD